MRITAQEQGKNTVTAAYMNGYRAASERHTTELKRRPLALQGLQQLRYSATKLMIFMTAYQLISHLCWVRKLTPQKGFAANERKYSISLINLLSPFGLNKLNGVDLNC